MATIDDVKQFLDECGYYFLATEKDGQPYVRPFGAHNIFEGKLYFQTGKVKDVAAQLAANPKAELSCFDGAAGTWLRVAGQLVNDDRVEAKKHMLDNYPDLRGRYDENDSNTQVLYFKDATATFASFTAEPKVIRF